MKFQINSKHIALSSALMTNILLMGYSHAANPGHMEMNHNAGAYMVETQAMRMNMDGLRSKTSDVSLSEAVNNFGYMMLPENMTMDMFMVMPMYNFTKDLSSMVMFNYLSNKMDMTNGTGTCKSTMETSGLGDTQVGINYKFMDDFFAAGLEMNIPTGSIEANTTMKMGMACTDNTMTAPYHMQLGSGTYDLTPSITYLGAYFNLRYGAQASFKYRIGENDQGYTLGNVYKAKLWVNKPISMVKLSAEVDVIHHKAIDGVHAAINAGLPTPLVSTANSKRLDAFITIGAEVPVSIVAVGLDIMLPVYQNTRGLQMKHNWSTALSVSAMF